MRGLEILPACAYPGHSRLTEKEPPMIVKQPRRTMEFGEQDEDFIKKLAGDIGCHYNKASDRTYNLNTFNTEIQGERGIFAWVHKEDSDFFWVATRKVWVEQAKAKAMAGRKMSGINCFPRDKQHAEDSVCFNIKDDYQKTVRVLSLINKNASA
jgi:hypothetical protein